MHSGVFWGSLGDILGTQQGKPCPWSSASVLWVCPSATWERMWSLTRCFQDRCPSGSLSVPLVATTQPPASAPEASWAQDLSGSQGCPKLSKRRSTSPRGTIFLFLASLWGPENRGAGPGWETTAPSTSNTTPPGPLPALSLPQGCALNRDARSSSPCRKRWGPGNPDVLQKCPKGSFVHTDPCSLEGPCSCYQDTFV